MSAYVAKANAKFKSTGVHYFVIEIDNGDGRCKRVVPESYLDSSDFNAFDGVVLYSTDSRDWE